MFGLRGPYFAIGTLGVAVAGAELVASWQWVGAASGISMPVFPGAPQTQKLFFYCLLFALTFVVLLFLRWLYSTNFGIAINAIRDDEEKAEAMGLYTRRYKRTAWTIAAFFLGIAGAIFGNMSPFRISLDDAIAIPDCGRDDPIPRDKLRMQPARDSKTDNARNARMNRRV